MLFLSIWNRRIYESRHAEFKDYQSHNRGRGHFRAQTRQLSQGALIPKYYMVYQRKKKKTQQTVTTALAITSSEWVC